MGHTARNSMHHKARTIKDNDRGPKRTTLRTAKIQDRLTYCPQKHKQKFVKGLRKKISIRSPQNPQTPFPDRKTLRVGSININGLDLEATWAVEQILANHELDVSLHNHNTHIHLILYSLDFSSERNILSL